MLICPAVKTAMELPAVEILLVAVWSVIQCFRSDNGKLQMTASLEIIWIANHWSIQMWSESKLADAE
jgi:hypothetical protein